MSYLLARTVGGVLNPPPDPWKSSAWGRTPHWTRSAGPLAHGAPPPDSYQYYGARTCHRPRITDLAAIHPHISSASCKISSEITKRHSLGFWLQMILWLALFFIKTNFFKIVNTAKVRVFPVTNAVSSSVMHCEFKPFIVGSNLWKQVWPREILKWIWSSSLDRAVVSAIDTSALFILSRHLATTWLSYWQVAFVRTHTAAPKQTSVGSSIRNI